MGKENEIEVKFVFVLLILRDDLFMKTLEFFFASVILSVQSTECI